MNSKRIVKEALRGKLTEEGEGWTTGEPVETAVGTEIWVPYDEIGMSTWPIKSRKRMILLRGKNKVEYNGEKGWELVQDDKNNKKSLVRKVELAGKKKKKPEEKTEKPEKEKKEKQEPAKAETAAIGKTLENIDSGIKQSNDLIAQYATALKTNEAMLPVAADEEERQKLFAEQNGYKVKLSLEEQKKQNREKQKEIIEKFSKTKKEEKKKKLEKELANQEKLLRVLGIKQELWDMRKQEGKEGEIAGLEKEMRNLRKEAGWKQEKGWKEKDEMTKQILRNFGINPMLSILGLKMFPDAFAFISQKRKFAGLKSKGEKQGSVENLLEAWQKGKEGKGEMIWNAAHPELLKIGDRARGKNKKGGIRPDKKGKWEIREKDDKTGVINFVKRPVLDAIRDLNERLEATKEGVVKGSKSRQELAKIIRQYRKLAKEDITKIEETKTARSVEINGFIDKYLTTKITATEMAGRVVADSLKLGSYALIASGLGAGAGAAGLAWTGTARGLSFPALGLVKGTQTLNRINRQQGETVDIVKNIGKVFSDGAKKIVYEFASVKGEEKTKREKLLLVSDAIRTIWTSVGVAPSALMAVGDVLHYGETAMQEMNDHILPNLAETSNWEDIAKGSAKALFLEPARIINSYQKTAQRIFSHFASEEIPVPSGAKAGGAGAETAILDRKTEKALDGIFASVPKEARIGDKIELIYTKPDGTQGSAETLLKAEEEPQEALTRMLQEQKLGLSEGAGSVSGGPGHAFIKRGTEPPMWQKPLNEKQMSQLPAYLEKATGAPAPTETVAAAGQKKIEQKVMPIVVSKKETITPTIVPPATKPEQPTVPPVEAKQPTTTTTGKTITQQPIVGTAKQPTVPVTETKPPAGATKITETRPGAAETTAKPKTTTPAATEIAGQVATPTAETKRLSNEQIDSVIKEVNSWAGMNINKNDLIHKNDTIVVTHSNGATHKITVEQGDNWWNIIKKHPDAFDQNKMSGVELKETSGMKSGGLEETEETEIPAPVRKPAGFAEAFSVEKQKQGAEQTWYEEMGKPEKAPAAPTEKFYAPKEREPELPPVITGKETTPAPTQEPPVQPEIVPAPAKPATPTETTPPPPPAPVPEKTQTPTGGIETWLDLKPQEKSLGAPKEIQDLMGVGPTQQFIRTTHKDWETFRVADKALLMGPVADNELYYSTRGSIFGKLEKNQNNVLEPKNGIYVWQGDKGEEPLEVVAAPLPDTGGELLVNKDTGRIFNAKGEELVPIFPHEEGEPPIYYLKQNNNDNFCVYDNDTGKIAEVPIEKISAKIFDENDTLKKVRTATNTLDAEIFSKKAADKAGIPRQISIAEQVKQLQRVKEERMPSKEKSKLTEQITADLLKDLEAIKPQNQKSGASWVDYLAKQNEKDLSLAKTIELASWARRISDETYGATSEISPSDKIRNKIELKMIYEQLDKTKMWDALQEVMKKQK
ncbi:MAG: hypothetical protein M1127_01815 [Patescibacteria group bacterium]|nr:hypothetical protein [Patescibacteria group bacterium]